MNQKKLLILFICLFGLGVLFFFVQSADTPNGKHESLALLSDVSGEQIAKIKLEQGGTSLDLELKEGIWTVPSRGGYPADFGKVKGLVLKLLDLNVSQRVTDSEANFESLGLTEKAVQAGKSAVHLLDAANKELAGVFLGELRKKKPDPSNYAPPSGQYIRRIDQKQAYLIPEAITIAASAVTWLETNVVNLLSSKVYSVQQFSVTAEGEKSEFQLDRLNAEDGAPAKFALASGLGSDEKLKDAAQSQVGPGLENLALADVLRSDDATVKDLNFDRKSVYRATNGLRYTAFTAMQGEKGYLKLRVELDPELIEKLKAANSASSTAGTSLAATSSSEGAASSAAAKSVEPLATAEEAKKIDDKLQGWVYEIRKFQADKLRFSREGLIEKPAASSLAASSAGASSAAVAATRKK